MPRMFPPRCITAGGETTESRKAENDTELDVKNVEELRQGRDGGGEGNPATGAFFGKGTREGGGK